LFAYVFLQHCFLFIADFNAGMWDNCYQSVFNETLSSMCPEKRPRKELID